MPTPKQGYMLDGEKIPGTTTIIGRFKESGGLIQWAYKQGREHEGLARQGKEAPRHLYDVTEAAADTGTKVHSLVEAHIKGAEGPSEWLDEPAVRSGYDAYLSWERMTRLQIVEQEIALVSRDFRFGGTPDAIGIIDGAMCLIDWKTSNGVYQDYLIQLAAYRHLWNVNNPDRQLTGGSHLCRFSKEHGDFAHHYYPDLSDAWEAFKLMRALYDIDHKLKRRAA